MPEMSMVGRTEQQLTDGEDALRGRRRAVRGAGEGPDARRRDGAAEDALRPRDAEAARRARDRRRRAEIIHIGQAVLAFGGTIEYFRDTVFNYPTLAEAYKVAALAGLNRL